MSEAARTSRRRRGAACLATLLGLLALAAILSDGTAGGDEGGVLLFASHFRADGWNAMLSQFHGGFLAHRLFWMIEKIGWDEAVGLVLPSAWGRSPLIETYALVLDGPLFMVAAFALATWHLRRRGHDLATALLAPAALLVASSAISLFTGGFSECIMCLLVVGIMCLMDQSAPLTLLQLALLTLCATLLVFCKLYALPFVLALTLLPRASLQRRAVYAAIVCVALLAWLTLMSRVMEEHSGDGIISFYTRLMMTPALRYFAGQTTAFFLSLPFGLLPCFPLILLAFFCATSARRGLAVKALGLAGVAILLLPFSFWYGPGGTAGPRYIVPFLLILLPEIAQGIAGLAAMPRARRILLAIPLLGTVFLPVLEYRNTLIGHYGVDVPVSRTEWPHADPGMHPAVFAWRVLVAKSRGDAAFTPSSTLGLTLSPAEIFPMTGLSRVIYLLQRPKAHSVESNAIHTVLFGKLLHDTTAWMILRALLMAGLLGTLGWAALVAGRRQ